ncbi:MAG: MFS transporter [Candidatus Methanofastidiosia archaeon]
MSKWRSFINISLVDFSARLSYNVARTPLLPLFALFLGASPSLIGMIVGASTVTGIFLKAPSGALSDYIGRKKMLLFGAFLFAVMPFSYIFATVAWMLIIIRIIHGMATSIYGPVANAVVANIAGREKGKYMSIFSLIKIGTNALGGLIGGWLLYYLAKGQDYNISDFRYAYLFCGVLGIFALTIAFFVLPKVEPSTEHREIKDSFDKIFDGLNDTGRNLKILMTSSMESFQNMTMGAAMAFLPILAVKEYNLSVLQAGILWSVITGTSVVLKPVMGYVSDRMERWKLISLGMFVCGISFVGFTLTSDFYLLIVVSIFFGLAEAFVTTSTIAYVAEVASEKRLGASLGVFGTIADTGQALGPIIIGILLTYISYFSSFVIISLFIVLWTILYAIIQIKEKRVVF